MSMLNTVTARLRRNREWNRPIFKRPPQDIETLRRGLITAVAARAKLPEGEVDSGREFSQFGFDSLSLVAFSAKLEDWLQIKLMPTVLWDHPTIDLLTEHLVGQLDLDSQRRAG